MRYYQWLRKKSHQHNTQAQTSMMSSGFRMTLFSQSLSLEPSLKQKIRFGALHWNCKVIPQRGHHSIGVHMVQNVMEWVMKN